MNSCMIILPHFDDEYCGLRSIVESPNWNVDHAVVVTDSTTQIDPQIPTPDYFNMRHRETHKYLWDNNYDPKIIALGFPEQLWITYPNMFLRCRERLAMVITREKPEWIFVPWIGDEHDDHHCIGNMFYDEWIGGDGPIAQFINVVYYQVHEPTKGHKYTKDGMPFKETHGKEFSYDKFRKLYPSQSYQVPPRMGQELYFSWGSKECAFI